MAISGASAICRKKIFSPGMSAMPAGSSFSDRVWKLSRIKPSAGWSARRTISQACPYSEVTRPQASASKPTRRPRRAARSASACSCAAASAGSSATSGEVLEQHSMSDAPMACMTSNLRSARSRLRRNCASGMPSKSRKGWYRSMVRPRSAAMRPSSVADPLKLMKSASKSSKPSKPAAAMASSFWRSVPLRETVAMERCMAWPSTGLRHAPPDRSAGRGTGGGGGAAVRQHGEGL